MDEEQRPERNDELDNLNKLEKLAERLDNIGISEYIKLSQNIWKITWLNFLSGVSRGLGFTVGTAIVLAIAYKVLSQLVSMNIPYLTEMLTDFIDLIQHQMAK